MKFGSTSVGSEEGIKNIISIIKHTDKSGEEIGGIVVSSFVGVKEKLLEMAQVAAKAKRNYEDIYNLVSDRHIKAVKELVKDPHRQKQALTDTYKILNQLLNLLEGIYLIKELTPKTTDLVKSFGVRLSAYILTQALNDAGIDSECVDGRDLIRTNNSFGWAKVDFEKTNETIREFWKKNKGLLKVVSGAIGYTTHNETTTIGREGPSYTAAIIAAALGAERMELWADIDGIKTANPHLVPTAFSIKKMSYSETVEMSYFGAKMIHPPGLIPAIQKRIPIVIKNTFNSSYPGTIISTETSNTYAIKGISSISEISMITLQGSGMVAMPGVAARVFGALAKDDINLILITQSSSEHTICFAVAPADASKAKKALDKEFAQEMDDKIIDEVIVNPNCSIVAAVGDHMKQSPGVAAKLFTAIGDEKINVIAIAQGSSERNISVVVEKSEEKKAVNAIHKMFFGK